MPKANHSGFTVTHIGVFGTQAPRHWAAGLTVVPVKPGTRECAVTYAGRINNLPDDKQRATLLARYADHGIGLLLGQSSDNDTRSAAIDVDDDRLVRFVREIIGPAPAKFGSKGETLFVRVAADQRGTNIRNNELNPKQAVLELFVTGGHTVLPPTPHWKTDKPYRYLSGQTLPDLSLSQWPLCEQWKLELLRRVVSWKRLPEVLNGAGTNIPMRDLVWCSLAWFGPDPAAPDGELAKQALAALLPDDYQGDTDEQLDRLVDKALAKDDYPRPDDSKTTSLATRLLEAVADNGAELFHDGAGGAFVAVRCEHGGRETFGSGSQAARDWLTRLALSIGASVISRKTLDEVSGTLRARALEGDQHPVFVRVGASGQWPLVIDLGRRGDGQAIVVTADGFRVMADHGVRFVRPAGLLPLPAPIVGSELSVLQQLLALEGDDWVKLLAFMLTALRPRPPYMALLVTGVAGAGKSLRCETVKYLLDPNDAMRTSLPEKLNDLAVVALHERLPLFDNVSGMSQATSDLLCLILTGGGHKDRLLYTNQEQSVMKLPRPVILNGISDYVHQSDLLSRGIPLELSEPEQLLTEAEYWRRLEHARAALLGALYQIAAGGLSRLAQAEAPAGNRNADCLQWLAACEYHADLEPGTFARVIDDAQGEVDSERVQNDMAFVALSKVLEKDAWAGLMSDLQQEMNQQRPDSERPPPKYFPSDGNRLSKWLKRNKAALARAGVQFENRHTKQGALMCVWRDGQDANAAWERTRETTPKQTPAGRQATPKTKPPREEPSH
jgi:hypothetical protein